MKELKFNIQYMFQRKEFYLAIFISFAIQLIHVILNIQFYQSYYLEEIVSGEYQFILYNINISFNAIIVVIFPILFAMIFSDMNVLEDKRKTTNLLCMRLSKKKNILVRLFLSFMVTFGLSLIGFLYNYVLLRIIFGTGNLLSYTQEPAFLLQMDTTWFLDSIRIANPTLFILLISISVSFILGLLSSFSYAAANVINKKVVVYFVPLIFLIGWDILMAAFEIHKLSFIQFLQPFGAYMMKDYLLGCFLLLVFIFLLIIPKLCEKDNLI